MPETIQPFANLDAATEAALRASIVRFGVIIPVVKDQHGRILDGNQRARIAAELGATFDEIIVKVENDDEAREYARTLNADRRHLTPDQRREVVGALRSEGHSFRAIAGAVGASKSQVERDLSIVPDGTISPERVIRQGGGTYPASRPKAEPVAGPVPTKPDGDPAAVPLWDALVDIAERIEALAKHGTGTLAATVPAARQASTAKRLRRVGGKLGSIAWELERMNQPTPEEERAKREAEAAARPAKAQRELELARADLDRVAALYPDRDNKEKADARNRVAKAEDEILYIRRKAEDHERWESRLARNVTPSAVAPDGRGYGPARKARDVTPVDA